MPPRPKTGFIPAIFGCIITQKPPGGQLIERENEFLPGGRAKHFKRDLISAEQLEREPNMYLYEIVGTAEHTETGKKLIIYRPLYGGGGLYARPAEMFISPVDRGKYPEAKQKFRFEKL